MSVFIFGVCWCLVSVWHILLLRTGRKFDSGIFVLNIYICVSYVFVFDFDFVNFLIIFLLFIVSAIPVGLSVRLAGLLNRTW